MFTFTGVFEKKSNPLRTDFSHYTIKETQACNNNPKAFLIDPNF